MRKRVLTRASAVLVAGAMLGCVEATPPPDGVASVRVSPSTLTLAPGASTRLVAQPRDARGRPLTDRAIHWTSSDLAIASVSAAGVVRGIKAGETTIRASTEGHFATALVRVTPIGISLPYDLIYDAWNGTPGLGPSLYTLDGHTPDAVPHRIDVPGVWSARHPAPSPDGRYVAFSGAYGTARGIFIAARDGSSLRQLTDDEFDEQPAWSPDGARIAFRRWPKALSTSGPDIWVIPASGDGAAINLTGSHGLVGDHAPTWSPTMPGGESRIAYARMENGQSHIYVMGDDGSAPTAVTSGDVVDDTPTWSPDGLSLAFQRFSSDSDGKLWIVSATGSDARMLMPDGGPAGAQFFPAWSPDGRFIAFTWRLPGGTPQVYTVGADGSGVNRRTADPTFKEHPTWIWR